MLSSEDETLQLIHMYKYMSYNMLSSEDETLQLIHVIYNMLSSEDKTLQLIQGITIWVITKKNGSISGHFWTEICNLVYFVQITIYYTGLLVD